MKYALTVSYTHLPSTGEMPEGIEAQAHQALKNVKGLLDSQGLSFSNVVKTTVFLDNMDDFTTVNGCLLYTSKVKRMQKQLIQWYQQNKRDRCV